jgi:Domain of unknown function (DUF4932)
MTSTWRWQTRTYRNIDRAKTSALYGGNSLTLLGPKRYLFILFSGMLLTSALTAQSAKPSGRAPVLAKVDKRVELMSIVARLADYGEYVRNDHKKYADDVDAYFSKYKDHQLIAYSRRIRNSNSIAFDAIASMAVHLDPDLKPKVPFTDQIPDKRWGKATADEFVRLLRQFAKDSNADAFFAAHSDLYGTAEQRFQTIVDKVDFDWYKKFYGEVPKGSFNQYIGLLIGGMNFGPKVVYPSGREDSFAITGTWQTDKDGLPVYDDDVIETIIHEFNHSFINHLVFAREKEFAVSGEAMFKPVADKMKRLAYGSWQATMNESLVRAAVIRYIYDHKSYDQADGELISQRNLGFLWIDELFVLLGAYENNRKQYPTFRSFMPLIEGYYHDLVFRIETKVRKFDESIPRVVAMEPFVNGAQDVDPNLTQIALRFDRALSGKGYSISQGNGGAEHYPVEKVIGYTEANTKFNIAVKLKPGWDYEFVVTGLSFRTSDGYPLKTHVVKFRTRN